MYGLFYGKDTLPRVIDIRRGDLRWSKKYPDLKIKRLVVEMKNKKYVDIYVHEYQIIKTDEQGYIERRNTAKKIKRHNKVSGVRRRSVSGKSLR